MKLKLSAKYLSKENSRIAKLLIKKNEEISSLKSQLAQERENFAARRRALTFYGQHLDHCAWREDSECTCGYFEALASDISKDVK